MRFGVKMGLAASVAVVLASPFTVRGAPVAPPASYISDGGPIIPDAVQFATRPYIEYRTAKFVGWDPKTRGALIVTRFGNTDQVHLVASPGAARTQISFAEDAIDGVGVLGRGPDRTIYVSKDVAGNEAFQLYTLQDGRLSLLNEPGERVNDSVASGDGHLLGYASPRRDGTDDDLYVMDPRQPQSRRLVAKVAGSYWMMRDFNAADTKALVIKFISINDAPLYELDLSTGAMEPLGTAHRGVASFTAAKYAPDGSIVATSDANSDFIRLGRVDRRTGQFVPMNPEADHDVEDFALAPDGSFVAYTVNDDGRSRLKIMDLKTGRVRSPELPMGRIGEGFGQTNLIIAPWGDIGFTFSSARSADDTYSVDPRTLKVTRWTFSETGGLDTSVNVEPTILKVKSFDGTPISGFLYLPDPQKFKGPRPLVMSFHGGPEYQARPTFLGSDNYLLNELGVGLFYPNVRGSTGYGKPFSSMDNGPFKREDAVKDVGAFLDALARDPQVDARRIGVMGTSYGGYMTLASMTHYSARLRAGLERVGISNFVTFLENTQPYRREFRRPEYGDERDPKQRAQLEAISPTTRAADIRIPLMAEAGGNDPRVPATEAKSIVAAVRANGGNAILLIAKNEGHHFVRKENTDYQFWAEMMFWRQHLLGLQPPADAGGSSAPPPQP